MRSIHAGERVACEFVGCDATFTSTGDMKRHMRSIHAGERIACEFVGCDATFTDSGNMKKHMRSIHAGDRVVYDFSGAKIISRSSVCGGDTSVFAGRKRRAAEALLVQNDLKLSSEPHGNASLLTEALGCGAGTR